MRITDVEFDFERPVGLRTPVDQRPLLFRPVSLRGVTARNRIMVAPMSQYISNQGEPGDWQLVHLGQFAMGGAGIVFTEETAVEARGRRTHECTGIYTDEQTRKWRRVTDFLKDLGAVPAIQLGHGGRRASSSGPFSRRRALDEKDAEKGKGPWQTVSSTGKASAPGRPLPTALDQQGIRQVIGAWRDATLNALDAGFDIVEIHAAHSYLIFQFLSPMVNDRTDAYGGDRAGRMRFALELTEAVRSAWPKDKPLFFRISAVDSVAGWDMDDTTALSHELKLRGVDVIDCSSSSADPGESTSGMPPVPRIPGHHVPYAEHIRRETYLATVAVGMITDPHHAEAILQDGKADIIGIATELMCDPYWPAHAAKTLGLKDWLEVLPPVYAARLQDRVQQREQWPIGPDYEVPFRRK